MNNIRKALFVAALALTCGAYSSSAQIEVRVRPERPHYVRTHRPSPRHVWIGEEWRPNGSTYVFAGGRWAVPPHHGERWIPGHWRDTPHGTIWKPGHWR